MIFTFVFMLVLMTIIVALVGYAQVQIKSHRQAVQREAGLSIAEAGAELAIWKLNNQGGYNGESNTAYGNGVYSVTITNIGLTTKLLTIESFVPDITNPIAYRKIQVTTTTGSANVGFNYGVQAGDGGIKMDNNSTLNGNIYSNGNIVGAPNNVRITGNAIVAGPTGKISDVNGVSGGIGGNATAHFLEDVKVGGNTDSYDLEDSAVTGNVVATTISDCAGTVGGDAIYDTKVSCTVAGTETTPNPDDFVDPASEPLPILDAQIASWEQDALDGGTIGSQTISTSTSLGPKKIAGDLILTNNVTLTVTGTLWVTGSITLNQGTTLELSSGYGAQSGVVVAGITGDTTAGFIDAQNGSEINGSGTAGSYTMLLSQRNDTTDTAIRVSNNAAGAIFYAGNGVLEVSNNARGKELTGYKIHLNQGATITYESGLGSAQFGSSASGGWAMLTQSWQLLQ